MLSSSKSIKALLALSITIALFSFSGRFNSVLAQQNNAIDPDVYSVITSGQNISLTAPFNFAKSTFVFTPADNILTDTLTLNANPGPPNNGGSPSWAIFFDLIAVGSNNVIVTQMSTANSGSANASFSVEVLTYDGTALGGPVGSGHGSSSAGWTSLGTVPAVQGPTSNGISLIFTIPPIFVPAGDTTGVAVRFNVVGPRYYGTGSPPYSIYSDSSLKLVTGDSRSAPFTPTGSWFSSRALCGVIRYVVDSLTSVNEINTEIPDGYRLSQNYPNPFNPSTTIEFAIPERSNVTLKVFDMHGKEVATLANDEYTAGTFRVQWDAKNFASGVYFYKLQTNEFSATKKLVLIK